MRKITMMAACFALLLSSCVTNEESQSVTDIRNAKAEELKSLAALNNAEAETAKVLAAAEAAYKAAEAELKKAEAAKLAADAENEKIVAEAQAALLKAEAAYQEALAAQVTEEIEKAKLEYDALKAEYAARIAEAEKAKAEAEKAKADAIAAMELAKVTAEKELVKAQKQLAEQKQQLKEKLEEIDEKNAVTIEALYTAYVEATGYYQQAVIDLNAMKSYVDGVKAGLVSSEEALAALLESYESDIEEYVNAIALAEAKIATLEEYKGVPAEEIRAALVEANAKHFALEQAEYAALEAVSEMEEAFIERSSYQDYNGVYNVYENMYSYVTGYDSQEFNTFGQTVLATVYDYNSEAYVKDGKLLDPYWDVIPEDLNPCFAVKVEDNKTYEEIWIPLFDVTPTYQVDVVKSHMGLVSTPSNYLEYTLPNASGIGSVTNKVYYNVAETVGSVNKEGFEALVAYFMECSELYSSDVIVEDLNAFIENAKVVLEKAKAWNDAYVAYADALNDVSVDEVDGVKTTIGLYNEAVAAVVDAKTAYETAEANVENLKANLAAVDTKETRWALEDAIEPLKAPVAETAKALKAAQDTLVVKEKALVVAQTAQKKAAADLEAAEIAERAAKKAWEAASAVVTEAGDKATQAQKDAETAAKTAYDKAVEATIKAQTDLATAEAAVAAAEGDVATAEAAVEAAQTAADNAAAALKTAEENLAAYDAYVAQLKKELGWAEADLAPLKAAWDAAVVAVEEAEAAVEAVKATLPELLAVLEAGDLKREYEVAVAAFLAYEPKDELAVGMQNVVYAASDSATAVENAESAIEMYENQIEALTLGDSRGSFVAAAEATEAYYDVLVAALEASADVITEFNEASKAYAEAVVALELADFEASLAYAEVEALTTALNEATHPDGIAAQIAALEGEIEDAKEAIEGIEEAIELAKTEVENGKDVVAYWESQLASLEAYVTLCEAQVAEAKAEFDAAVEAAAKAE